MNPWNTTHPIRERTIDAMRDLLNRLAEQDCAYPWGVSCDRTSGGETWCEYCESKVILFDLNLDAPTRGSI